MKRLRVLLSAYSCRPGMGSEPGVGWNTARELVKYHQVWLLTRADNRSLIEAELSDNPIPGLEVVYCDLPGILRLKSGQQFHYYLWQLQAYFVAQKLHHDINFDLVHHVTYVKYWSPSFLSLLPIPFIWGPVGGGESAPKVFWQEFGWRGKAYEMTRDLARWLGECDPFVRLTAKRSVLARATTQATAERLWMMGAKKVQVISQLGMSTEELAQLQQHSPSSDAVVRFISIGRLLHWKGFHLGIRAFAQADLPDNAEYWIIGDGPEQQRLQRLVQELGITDKVKFWNMLSREQTLQKLRECSVLVHPSLHESGGLVCLEAMAASCPVVCLDLGGPAIQVTKETGFKIPATTPEQAVYDLAQAITRLANNSDLCLRMGQAAQKRVNTEYSWQVKGQLLAQLYRDIFGQRVTSNQAVSDLNVDCHLQPRKF